MFRTLRQTFLFAALIALCAASVPALATTWEVYTNFGVAANPNGQWSYGYSVTLGGEMGLFDMAFGDLTSGGGWTRSMGGSPTYSPYTFYNPGAEGTYPANSVVYSSGDPGEDEYTVYRWTAPADGWYTVNGAFKQMKIGSSWTGRMDNHVLVNGVSRFDCVVNGLAGDLTVGPGPYTTSFVAYLKAGGTVDFTGGTFNGSVVSDFTDITGCGAADSDAFGIAGVVTSSWAGNPAVSGATVTAVGAGVSTTTDGDGTYGLVLPAGTYTIEVSKAGYVTQQQTGIVVTTGQTTIKDIVLVPNTGLATGLVTINTTGHPVAPGVTVTEQTTLTSVVTDADGAYQLEAIPGTHTLEFKKDGLVTKTVSNVVVTAGNTTTVPTVDMDIHTPVTYYVSDATGNDTNDGLSRAASWKTIQRGDLDGTVMPGDTVKVWPGTYPQTTSAGFQINRGGDEFQRVTYMKDETSTGKVLINMTPDLVDDRGFNTGIVINASDVNLDGFEVTGACWGIVAIDYHADIDISNCEVHAIRPGKPLNPLGPNDPGGIIGTCMGICNSQCTNVVNRNNLIYDIGEPGLPNVAACIISPGCTGLKIYNNTLADSHAGFDTWVSSSQTEIKNNIIANMRTYAFAPSYAGEDNGGQVTRTNNFYFNNNLGNFGWADAVLGEGEFNCNPKLTTSYTLDAGSLAANMGVDVGLPFTAPAPDLGAFESSLTTQANSFVQGTVTSTVTGNPALTRATISAGGAALGMADLQGKYKFPVVAGTYSMTCARGGFASQTASVTTTTGNTTTKDWSLAKVAGSTWYVKPATDGGNDENTGMSAGAAWATITRGDILGVVKPGDTVMVADGLYPQANYLGARLTKCFGEVGAPITYKGSGNASINQDGIKADDFSSMGIDIDTDYTVIDGFDVSMSQFGVVVRDGRKGTVVANNYLHDFYEGTAGAVTGGVYGIAANGLDIHKNLILNSGDSGAMSNSTGSVLLNTCSNVKVQNNTLVRSSSGINGWGGGTNHDVRNNIMTDMWWAALNYVTNPDASTHSNNLFFNNTADYGRASIPGRIEFNTDPMFDFGSFYGFGLSSSSPAINMGVDVGLDFEGPAPDLGAYETDITTPPTQYGFVTGTVKYRSDHSPAVGAKVQAIGQTSFDTVDSEGVYLLMLEPGTYTIQASKFGECLLEANVTVTGGATATQNFWFTQGAYVPLWDLVDDWSITNGNPNGVWSYGQLATPDPSGFTLFLDNLDATTVGYPGLQLWMDNTNGAVPAVYCNINPTQSQSSLAPMTATIHPADTGAPYIYGVARWTAPSTGTFFVKASFGTDFYPSYTTDAHVFHNATELLSNQISGGAIATYQGALAIVTGDTVDMAVGNGGNGYLFDNTAVAFQIVGIDTTVATPATIAEAKAYGDGKLVSFTTDKVVTAASGTFTNGSCYIEDSERTSGIKVVFNSGIPAVALGNRIQFNGTMGTDTNGERFIQITSVTSKTAGTALVSLGMTNKTFGAGKIGVLVKVWGQVVEKAIDGSYVIVDDGSGLTTKVMLTGSQVTTNVTVGKYMTVTGPAGRIDDGTTIETVVRPRNNNDIVLYTP